MDKKMKKDVEELLRGDSISNPEHKAALRSRLFSENAALSINDLDQVAGGVMAEEFKFEDWSDIENSFDHIG